MKKIETLDEAMTWINHRHRKVNAKAGGVHGYKMLRKPDGRRILFEEIKGFRVFKWKEIDDTTLMIQTLANGFKFRGQEKTFTVSSWLYLTDLAVVNLYDHRAEFFSGSSIDFSYVENDFTVELEMLSEWVHDETAVLRAQWVAKNESVERILEEISYGKSPQHKLTERRRFLDIRPRGYGHGTDKPVKIEF